MAIPNGRANIAAPSVILQGVEPSRSLQTSARARGLLVHLGVLPHADALGPYDVLTMIDVVEHVPNPVGVLRAMRGVMAEDDIAAVVTPDRPSVAARLMGWKWWHYRIAHLGYFDRSTLSLAIQKAGLELVATLHPGWYFPAGYLCETSMRWPPIGTSVKAPRFPNEILVPLNLRDSFMAIGKLAYEGGRD